MIKKVSKGILGGIMLTLFMAGSVLAAPEDFPESDQTGKITIHAFEVDDYDNLQGSSGAITDRDDLTEDAVLLQHISFSIQRLDDSAETAVSVRTPADQSFQKRTGVTDASGELVFAELPKGYYLVTQTATVGYTMQQSAFVVMLPMRSLDADGKAGYNYDVHVYPKSAAGPVITKEAVNATVVGVGDEVIWEISYPVDSGIKKATDNGFIYATDFYITDTMDSRLDYVAGSANFKVFDASGKQLKVEIKKGIHYLETYDQATRTVTWRYTDQGVRTMADNNAALATVRIKTVVNESALGSVEAIWNNAAINFINTSGDPYRMEVFADVSDKNGEGIPKVYPGSITIDKYEQNREDVKLGGVTFKVSASKEKALKGEYLKVAGEDYQITTDENGYGRFTALGAGEYWLTETRAAAGYQQLDKPVKVTIGNTSASANAKIAIANTKLTAAADGGVGGTNKIFAAVKTGDMTKLIYLIISAAVAAIAVFIARKKIWKKPDDSGNR